MQTLEQASVTLVAGSFNLSIFNQLWLVESGIVTEQDIKEGNAFNSPVAVSIATDKYELLIVPDRVQVTIRKFDDKTENLLNRIICKIVSALPQTPYKAIGFNFNLLLTPNNQIEGLKKVKSLYLSSENPLSNYYQNEDSRFGMYLSTESLQGTRLRLNIKPSKTDSLADVQSLHFNYHSDLNDSDNRVKQIIELMGCWEKFKEHSFVQTTDLDNYIEG